MDANEFVGLISQLNTTEKAYSLGKIQSDYVSGRPQIVFDGAVTASSKKYPYLSSYTPSANDRVLIANVGGTHVILGKVT